MQVSAMLSPAIHSAFPALAQALEAMRGKTDIANANDQSSRQRIVGEIQVLLASADYPDEFFPVIWADMENEQSRLLKFSTSAYHYLGVSDEVRDFMGRLWCYSLQQLTTPLREQFLRSILDEKRTYLFESLDFAPPIFRHIPLTAAFMMSWVRDARKAVGNDLYQRGLWRCLENYARFQPEEALRLLREVAPI